MSEQVSIIIAPDSICTMVISEPNVMLINVVIPMTIAPANRLILVLEYDKRTSVERSNKREKEDYKFRRRLAPLYEDVVLPPLRHHDAKNHY